MNKTKKMSILFATIGILAFSLIPAVSAGVPGHMKERPDYNNLLMPWWIGGDFEFSASEDLYFRIGWYTSPEEIENDIAPKHPWKYKLFINDEEINLQRYGFVLIIKEIDLHLKFSYWYHVFGPGYFEAGGEYLLRFEFWVKRPYMGDGLNHWRIMVDHWGLYLPAGAEHRFEYYLNIVA